MTTVTINFEKQVKSNGNSVAIAEVVAETENLASSLLDTELENNYPQLGRSDCHFEENGKFYYSINS